MSARRVTASLLQLGLCPTTICTEGERPRRVPRGTLELVKVVARGIPYGRCGVFPVALLQFSQGRPRERSAAVHLGVVSDFSGPKYPQHVFTLRLPGGMRGWCIGQSVDELERRMTELPHPKLLRFTSSSVKTSSACLGGRRSRSASSAVPALSPAPRATSWTGVRARSSPPVGPA